MAAISTDDRPVAPALPQHDEAGMSADRSLFIGLMSGTSMDGVDGVLVRFAASPGDSPLRVLAYAHHDMHGALRDELLALNNEAGDNELHRAALAANALARLQAAVVAQLLQDSGVAMKEVAAIGSHGQTVRHRPGEFDGTGYTLQLNNGALLAELTGIDVICDLRSRDVAAGGQGAPLVPAFHATVFGLPDRPRAVLNLGGIGNLSLLPAQRDAEGRLRGFDSGPGNALLDHWVQRHLSHPFDDDGVWAAGGQVDPGLLAVLLTEPYLQLPPPKSTGRDLFNPAWLQARLQGDFSALAAQDVQATLAEFTARAAAQALQRFGGDASQPEMRWADLLVCGGGALNGDLMRRLASALPGLTIRATDALGLPALQVEAAAFAWLAQAFLLRQAGNRAEVTGARGARLLGALYPAG